MPRPFIKLAKDWKPDPDDPRGEDKRLLLDFLLKEARGRENAISLERVRTQASFAGDYTRESLQMNLMVPLRSQGQVFIGTSNKGIFLIEKPEDADTTISFYTTRIRSELHHVRNLKTLARRHHLFSQYRSEKSASGEAAIIYFDESGTPSLRDRDTQPFFIVCGVVVESERDLRLLEKRLAVIRTLMEKPPDYEFKSTGLSKKKYQLFLKELGPADFRWSCVCFVKDNLTGVGFNTPKTFYQYAYQFLVGDLLTVTWNADLYFDEYGGKESAFEKSFKAYVKDQNAGLPPQRIKDIKMLSSNEALIQLADVLAGVVKNREVGKFNFVHLVDDKAVQIRVWPPD